MTYPETVTAGSCTSSHPSGDEETWRTGEIAPYFSEPYTFENLLTEPRGLRLSWTARFWIVLGTLVVLALVVK